MAGVLATATWLRSRSGRPVRSREELDRLLVEVDEVAKDEGPLFVVIERESGDVLGIGLGEKGAWLMFLQASGDPLQSVGDGDAGEEINFYDGHEGPYVDNANLVPILVARSAAREFLTEGTLASDVRWEET